MIQREKVKATMKEVRKLNANPESDVVAQKFP
jgi:hypothetical protein